MNKKYFIDKLTKSINRLKKQLKTLKQELNYFSRGK